MDENELKKDYLDTMNELNQKAETSFWSDLKLKLGLSGWTLGFMPTLAVLFIILKIIGLMPFGWFWVLCPIWIPAAVVVYRKIKERINPTTPTDPPTTTT